MKTLRIGLMVASVISMGCFGAVGSGRDATQAREVGAFKRLQVQGGLQATVTQGVRTVSITADDNLHASGSSTGNLSDLSATRITLDVGGGSTVRLGAAESVTGSASGGSTVTIQSARSVTVDATGGSSVTSN